MQTVAYSTLVEAGNVPRVTPRFTLPSAHPPGGDGDWHYYGVKRGPRIPWVAVLLSVGLHAFVFFGLNHKAPAPKKHVVKETDVVQMVMPEIKDLDEPPPTELQDDTQNTPQVDVPSLADMPSAVDVSMGFVQPLDVRPPVPADIGAARLAVVPVNIAHGPRSDGGGLKDIFNLADLDRIPEAISQVAPRFPAALKREFDYAEVKLEFIVDTAGGVRGITIVSSTAQGFDEAAVEGISKWRFRPGMKAGKKVNTRVQQLLKFKVTDDDK